jgi:eukaryotic-like serine/threonine-protein kinase
MVTAPGANVSGVRLAGGAHVVLGPVLAKAGEGTIYAVADRPTWVAKVFHPTLSDLAAKVDKVAAMIGAPPPGAIQQDGFVVLAWPMHLLESDRGAVGYVMPRIDTATAVEIHTLSNPSNRANPLPTAPQWPKGATWSHLVNVAANLCVAVEAAHRVDAVIGDFQERNILVADTTRVTLVDCDSMQFSDASGRQFLCGVGRPEFTAPELATASLRTQARDEPSDLFALAVHIHLLLMAGNHPFLRGGWTGAGDQPDALTLAAAAHWAGGWQSPLHTHPLAPPVSFLPADIQHLFLRAFTTGAHDPTLRPTATEWRTTLLRIQTTPCPQGTHHIPTGCTTCPWCAITTERQARKVSSGAAAIGTRAARPPSRRGAEARTATPPCVPQLPVAQRPRPTGRPRAAA